MQSPLYHKVMQNLLSIVNYTVTLADVYSKLAVGYTLVVLFF
jgi:hypothetical protein